MDQEQRLIRLEETVYFQEQKISELESQILSQQKRLDLQEWEIRNLKQVLIRLKEDNELLFSSQEKVVPEIPPHYQSIHWHRE